MDDRSQSIERPSVHNAIRMATAHDHDILAATYVYNELGQRTRKITNTGTTVYHYDLNGQLLAETDANGAPIRDYLWNEQLPLAQIDFTPTNETIAYLHTEPLATQCSATSDSRTDIWRCEGALVKVTKCCCISIARLGTDEHIKPVRRRIGESESTSRSFPHEL